MSLEKKYTLWDVLCRIVQSVFLAAEITVLADLLFAAGENPLPRAAFWGLFLAAAAALSLWRGFTRKGRRIVFLSIAGAAVLSALAIFAAWSAAAPKTVYEAPETEPKAIFSEKRVLAVVPHEDDDLNLLSGVTEQFTDAGSEVYVVFVSTGDAAGLGEKRVYEAINALSLDGVPEEIFTHAAELREMGLGIPGAAALAEELRARGAAVPQGIYTPHDLAAALLARKEGGAC